jgi:uncharacterized membrane protein YeaQ/YmgE (transglycosylase-associated protein family)
LVIGITGAVLGGLVGGLLSAHPRPYHFRNVDSWATAVMGSSLLLFAATQKDGNRYTLNGKGFSDD